MLASGATSWGAWDVPAAKLSPPVRPFPVRGFCICSPSMGPPPFGDGNVQSRAARLLSICCPFNGATAFRRWKPTEYTLANLRGD